MLQRLRWTKLRLPVDESVPTGAPAHSGSVLSVLRLWNQRVAGSKPEWRRRPCIGSPVALRGRPPAGAQSKARPQSLRPESQPTGGPRHTLTQHPRVGGRSVGESRAPPVGPVGVLSRGGEDHRLRVPPRSVEGELWRGAAGFGGRGGQRVHLPSGGEQLRRPGGGGGEGGVAFGTLMGSRGGGGQGPGEEGSGPVVFKDLDGQRGDERQQPVGDVSQNQLLVGVAADTNVGGAGLRKMKDEGGRKEDVIFFFQCWMPKLSPPYRQIITGTQNKSRIFV